MADLNFFSWSFGNEAEGSPILSKSTNFKFHFNNISMPPTNSYRQEMLAAAKELNKKRGEKTIALCHGGGIDSEAIAIILKELKIPYEIFFLDNWGLNTSLWENWVLPFANRVNKVCHRIECSRPEFMIRHMENSFEVIGCEFPTYLAMTYLFNQIPEDKYYIVTGDGDLNRSGPLFEYLGNILIPPEGKNTHIIYPSSSVAYYLWARFYNRSGEFYFYSSKSELLISMFHHPLAKNKFPFFDTREAVHSEFPEIQKRPKSTNWDTPEGKFENKMIRRAVRRYMEEKGYNQFWKDSAACLVDFSPLLQK